jgi:hypothetical protein
MKKRMDKNRKSGADLKDVVVVTVVDDMEQAREYETLLRLNDIPALVREQMDPAGNKIGVAILVPEDYLDEAHVVIESQDAYDDFYDFGEDSDEDADFETDLFDDEF